MKALFLAVFLLASSSALEIGLPVNSRVKRVSSGVNGAAGENLDYVMLTIVFYNQRQTCGGILIHPQFVMTTATCVIDPVEGIASIVNATFPEKTTNNVIQKSKIFIHEEFDQTTRANNIALIKLRNATVTDNKTLALADFSTDNRTDIYVYQILRICGFGTTANYYTPSTVLKCAKLFAHPTADCGTVANTICTYWEDGEENACSGDYGGALYQYSYNGTKIKQTVIGMASFSPDYRKNTPCKGGQKVVHVQTSFYLPWAINIISKN